MMLRVLDVLGWFSALLGVIEMVRGLVFHSSREGMGNMTHRPFGTLSPAGKRHFFLGVVLLVLGNVLKDIIPAMLTAGGQ